MLHSTRFSSFACSLSLSFFPIFLLALRPADPALTQAAKLAWTSDHRRPYLSLRQVKVFGCVPNFSSWWLISYCLRALSHYWNSLVTERNGTSTFSRVYLDRDQ
ncbi:hypothetical protein F4825DRAFT_244522 [Nemania diffusa]|nr:hypothetical protein F4825DRAFT_244522 [Nemania diffusa]